LAVLDGGTATVGGGGEDGLVVWAKVGDAAHNATAATDMRSLFIRVPSWHPTTQRKLRHVFEVPG
jgi:hypothetical protein